jgi:hypothetical protein
MKKLTFLLIIALFALPASAIKYVAVVETEVDARSGASEGITPAEVTLITAELRREAVKNLPRGQYSVMTSETVIAQGSATLEQCFDENCVIALGSKIGADYIVRGTISKFQTLFTLTVEVYETEDGNLVASSDPVRSENIRGLLENAAPVCAEMYKTFAAQTPSPASPEAKPSAAPSPAAKPSVAAPKKKPSFWAGVATDIAGAGMLTLGIFQDNNVKEYVKNGQYDSGEEYKDVRAAVRNRNICYAVGSALLMAGVSVHIFF